MHESVRRSFPEFSKRFEGYVRWMYLDIKGLVTVGIGNLVDPEHLAVVLPFTDKATGQAATQSVIAAEWRMLKGTVALAQRGHKACEAVTQLRLSDEAIGNLVRRRLVANERVLKEIFPELESWPADGQLGVFSIAWAAGAALSQKFPNFTAACRRGDWPAAVEHGRLREQGNPGVIPRNVANARLFRNAAAVVAQGLEPSRLFYPESVPIVVA
jgi:GH24 family phage-related lysozyme (muramidase)